jgi:uncharacterized RDD family membrane protein YckC
MSQPQHDNGSRNGGRANNAAAPPPPYPADTGFQAPDQPGRFMGRQLANWSERMGASLIDALLIVSPALAAMIYYATSNVTTADVMSGHGGRSVLINDLLWLCALLFYVYDRWLLQGRTGQTWGKRILHLRLVRMDNGYPVGPGHAFIRDLAHMLDVPCIPIGILWPLWDDRRQTFADKLASTVVLSDADRGTSDSPDDRRD